jgi:hypothetical protein
MNRDLDVMASFRTAKKVLLTATWKHYARVHTANRDSRMFKQILSSTWGRGSSILVRSLQKSTTSKSFLGSNSFQL